MAERNSKLKILYLNDILLKKTDAFTWISTVVITCLVIIFGETIPKIAAKKNATKTKEGPALVESF